jgi:hypothetical protein
VRKEYVLHNEMTTFGGYYFVNGTSLFVMRLGISGLLLSLFICVQIFHYKKFSCDNFE